MVVDAPLLQVAGLHIADEEKGIVEDLQIDEVEYWLPSSLITRIIRITPIVACVCVCACVCFSCLFAPLIFITVMRLFSYPYPHAPRPCALFL